MSSTMVRSGKPPNSSRTSRRKAEQQPEQTMGLCAPDWMGRCQWKPKRYSIERPRSQTVRVKRVWTLPAAIATAGSSKAGLSFSM